MDRLFKQFFGLLVFGNIENLVLACQGAVLAVDPFLLLGASLITVTCWFLIGTYGTKIALKYARAITFMGGFIIFVLGIQSVLGVLGII